MSEGEVTVTLKRNEAQHIASLIRQRVRKAERQYDPNFVPAPGRSNASLLAIDRGLELLAKFEAALGKTVQVWEDEEWVDE